MQVAAGFGRALRMLLQDDRRFVVATVAAAAAVRLAVVALGSPIDWQDGHIYYAAGRELLNGRLMESHIVMPLYPLFIALAGWDGVLYWQALLSAATVPLVWGLAREIFDRT